MKQEGGISQAIIWAIFLERRLLNGAFVDSNYWVNGNSSQINQARSWLSITRRVNVAREIKRIKNISASEADAMYHTWEAHILSKMNQGLVSIVQDIWMSYSDRDLAHEVLRKHAIDDYQQTVAKSDSELRDAALRKRARKNSKEKISRPSLVNSPTKIRRTSGTEFVTAPLASYSLQAEMMKAGIGSVEKLFEELDVIRTNLRQALITAERFDVSVDPNVLRVVLSRLFISSSVALHYAKHQLGSNDKEKFKSLLISAGITFIPVVHTQTSHQLLEFVTETIITSAKIDGRVDPSGAISGLFDLQILYDRSLLVSPLTEDYESRNARALIAAILIWLSATVEEHLEDACRFALIGESGRTLSHREYVAHLWAFGRAIARQEGWEWGS